MVQEQSDVGSHRRRIQIGIGKDHVGTLAAQFERQSLQRVRRIARDDLRRAMFTGECDLVDQRMFDAGGAGGGTESGNDIDHAVGKTDFFGKLCQTQTGQRCLLGRFHHDRAAGRQCRSPFPSRHQDRKVPGNDLSRDADRLATRVTEVIAANRDRAAVNLVGVAGVVTNAIDRQRQVDGAAVAQRFAVIECFQSRQFVDLGFHAVGQREHQLAAIAGIHLRPITGLERVPCGFGGGIDVGRVTFGDLRDFFFGGRIDGGERSSRWPLAPIYRQ